MTMPLQQPYFVAERQRFHRSLLASVLTMASSGVASNADKDNALSVHIARDIYNIITAGTANVLGARLAAQTSGNTFEDLVADYLNSTFKTYLQGLRPGTWDITNVASRSSKNAPLTNFEQYRHLADLQKALQGNQKLRSMIQTDYLIAPDVVIVRMPEDDHTINTPNILIDQSVARRAKIRKAYNTDPILHASISTKWTLRSDRAQNARSEALNMIRNRKGHLPHIVIVTGEPLPSRLASIALGTGDIDCVYHFALEELCQVVDAGNHLDAKEILEIMIDGKRLKDIADLPLDLAV
jgi:hypothetical protein